MEKIYIQDEKFIRIDFPEDPLKIADYENRTFINCNFSNTDLSKITFVECEFLGCNLCMMKLQKTALKEIKFKDCKLLGLHFDDCSEFPFAVDFDNCILNLSSFYKVKLKNTIFKRSTLHEVDFSEADLKHSIFDNCDLAGAKFENCDLQQSDFRTSYNYSIDPELNRITKAKFYTGGVAGLLDKYDIEIE
ncbi:MAG: pentapeptide repeat-containing protein [Flavitalea sp.]